jgi:hypothetical protein
MSWFQVIFQVQADDTTPAMRRRPNFNLFAENQPESPQQHFRTHITFTSPV